MQPQQQLPSEILEIQSNIIEQRQAAAEGLIAGSEWDLEDTLNQLLSRAEDHSRDDPDAHPDTLVHTDPPSDSDDIYRTLQRLQLGVRQRLAQQRKALALLTHRIHSAQSLDRMSDAQERITELFTHIHHLRSGATESEVIVREITRDIRSLDLAKRNVVASVTGVKRFQMLLVAYGQLEHQARSRKYRETAQALSAVKELANYFRTFTSIDRISAILRGIQEVQGSMRTQIMKDFEATLGRGRDSSLQHNAQGIDAVKLSEACLVLDAIGNDARQSLLEWYCNIQLHDYRRIFRPTEEAGQLDNLSRRFAWFRRLSKQYEDGEHAKIFPKDWKVPQAITGAFAAVTRDDLKSLLVRVAGGLDVKKLLEALSETVEFEGEIERKFGASFDKVASLSPITHGATIGTISSAFEPYLGIFVDAQDRLLSDMIAGWRNNKVSGEDLRAHSDHEQHSATNVLPSSTELFYFYRETLERCAQLSTKATFLELCSVYKKWLKVYAEEVLGSNLSRSERRSLDSRAHQKEVTQACTVLNTADYCAETTLQLESRLKERIDAEYRSRVSLEDEKDLFTTVISTAILSLLKELELSIEPALNSMLRSPWKDSTVVSSESGYMLDLTTAINAVADLVKTEIEHRKYFRSFCDKVVGLVIARFTQALVRARPISPVGAEQILLDIQRLKSCLLQLPRLAGEGQGSGALASYNRNVARGIERLDIMLQVIMSPASPPESFVDHYLALIPCQSFSDFQKMLDLKGVKRSEQNNLLDIFLAKTSLLRDLADTSLLTGIEMDGPGSSSAITGNANATGMAQMATMTTSVGLGGGMYSIGGGLSGIGLGLPGMHMNMPALPSSPNSALAHNINMLMSSLPMLHGVSNTSSGPGSRSGTPQLGQGGFGQGGAGTSGNNSAANQGTGSGGSGFSERPFGFKKIGRLFSKDG